QSPRPAVGTRPAPRCGPNHLTITEIIMRILLSVLFVIPFVCEAQVSVQEYPIPKGLYAHDVWADPAPGGPVYFSCQRSGHLGILDPKTGKVDTVPLGGNSSPHGVVMDREGFIWLTDGGQNAMARVDAKTKTVKLFPLPQGTSYANLNTSTADGQGLHWFT